MGMTRTEIQDALVGAIRAEKRIFLQKDAVALKESDRLAEDAGFDSVGLLYLVMAIEDAFDVEVDDAEAIAEHFRTWGDVLSYVEQAKP
jgi:acyl carrier protein